MVDVANKRVCVKFSGDDVGNPIVLDYVISLLQCEMLTIFVGSGHQINRAFEEAGFMSRKVPIFGRILLDIGVRAHNLAIETARKTAEEFKGHLVEALGNPIGGRYLVAPCEVVTEGVRTTSLVVKKVSRIDGDLQTLAHQHSFDEILLLTTREGLRNKAAFLRWVSVGYPGTSDELESVLHKYHLMVVEDTRVVEYDWRGDVS